jgi:hypothetical protein
MTNKTLGWDKLIETLRKQYNYSEYYLDEKEHVIIFSDSDKIVNIYGFLIYQSNLDTNATDLIEFVEFLEKIGELKFDYEYNLQINVVCNHHLTKIRSGFEIRKLPFNVKYFYYDYNYFYDNISKFELENPYESAILRDKWNEPLPKIINYEDIDDARFHDWDKWLRRGYKREEFEWNEIDRFERFQSQFGNAKIICYKDNSYLMKFYFVWKYLNK